MMVEVYRFSYKQMHVTIDSGPFVPPAFGLLAIHTDRNGVFLFLQQVIRNFNGEAGISAGVSVQINAIDPNDGIPVDSLEFDEDPFSFPRGIKKELLAVAEPVLKRSTDCSSNSINSLLRMT